MVKMALIKAMMRSERIVIKSRWALYNPWEEWKEEEEEEEEEEVEEG